MLTRNDRCFFALAFYRQTVEEFYRAALQDNNSTKINHLFWQSVFWWEEFQSRRQNSRLSKQ